MVTPRPIHPPPTTLYESDYLHWLTETAELLRSGQLDHIDILNLAEELDDGRVGQPVSTRGNRASVACISLDWKTLD